MSPASWMQVYNVVSDGSQVPIGGASRFATMLKSYRDEKPLILFSGDALSPSQSTFDSQLGDQLRMHPDD